MTYVYILMIRAVTNHILILLTLSSASSGRNELILKNTQKITTSLLVRTLPLLVFLIPALFLTDVVVVSVGHVFEEVHHVGGGVVYHVQKRILRKLHYEHTIGILRVD